MTPPAQRPRHRGRDRRRRDGAGPAEGRHRAGRPRSPRLRRRGRGVPHARLERDRGAPPEPGADAPALAAGSPTPAMTLRSGGGKRLGAVRASTARPGGAMSRTLTRSDLAGSLMAEVERRGIRVEYGRRLVGAEPTADGVRARFADGAEAEGDLLIGADGVHSAVGGIDPPAAPAPAYGGLLNTGGYAGGVRSGAEPGHDELIFGRRAFFGHVMAPQVRCGGSPTSRGGRSRSPRSWRAPRRRLAGPAARALRGRRGPAVELIRSTGDLMPVSPITRSRACRTGTGTGCWCSATPLMRRRRHRVRAPRWRSRMRSCSPLPATCPMRRRRSSASRPRGARGWSGSAGERPNKLEQGGGAGRVVWRCRPPGDPAAEPAQRGARAGLWPPRRWDAAPPDC